MSLVAEMDLLHPPTSVFAVLSAALPPRQMLEKLLQRGTSLAFGSNVRNIIYNWFEMY